MGAFRARQVRDRAVVAELGRLIVRLDWRLAGRLEREKPQPAIGSGVGGATRKTYMSAMHPSELRRESRWEVARVSGSLRVQLYRSSHFLP